MLKEVANIVRGLSVDAVEKANSGHPGMPVGCAEIGSLLYGEVLKHDPDSPNWPDRDRFVLSAGHGSMLLYSLLHLSGYDLSLKDLKNFRQLGSKTPGHPEYMETEGVETTTGPLGQGLANAVGMAITERHLAAKFNKENYNIVDHYTYTIMGDGCMMEGISSEAASLAGHLGLGKLIAIYDDNEISIEGSTDITFTESVPKRFESYNWQVIDNVDGHNINELRKAIIKAKSDQTKPTLIVAKTHIAYGAPNKQDTADAHGAPLGKEEIKGLKEFFDLPTDKEFYVSDTVKKYFEDRRQILKKEKQNWDEMFTEWKEKYPKLYLKWENADQLKIDEDLEDKIDNLDIDTPIATRKASGAILRTIADKMDYLIGGSADLAPSNKTYLDKYPEFQKNSYEGRNFRFGVREHAMGGIVNGMSLHKGVRPFAATFLVFSDYMRPAIRLAALMKQPVIYVFTHDSIFIGEDGPTHQPVEHLEALRVIPNLSVYRPGDADETKKAWFNALKRTDGPTALVLTRQSLPAVNKENGLTDFNKGGYLVRSGNNDYDYTFIASGSELSLAEKVADKLKEKDINSRIVSVPERKILEKQNSSYIDELLGKPNKKKVVIEAGVSNGWYRYLSNEDILITQEEFGASAPGNEVASHFGFDVEKIVSKLLS
ncbi:MAG: transketolase [Halanaerobiales bacterium]|nr:transketolase [Halanaerobiales bacterium]